MRLFVLILSLGSVVGLGRALGGLGGYVLGKGDLGMVVGGLGGGMVSGIGALLLWRMFLLREKHAPGKDLDAPKGNE